MSKQAAWMTEYDRGFSAGIRYALLKMMMVLPGRDANAAARKMAKGINSWPRAEHFDRLMFGPRYKKIASRKAA